MTDSTRRFSDRVEAYRKYRPGYPPAMISTLLEKTGLDDCAVVADVGSGTGIFSRLLLDQGIRVAAVEPNTNMRL
ncbi:MAG: class I SAM-dependent methyltransferase, partial [Gammaproteobacteria bacterium]|nr:class I SAM-dependent methyltransferase [Gammaproteobacteria bacterium]